MEYEYVESPELKSMADVAREREIQRMIDAGASRELAALLVDKFVEAAASALEREVYGQGSGVPRTNLG